MELCLFIRLGEGSTYSSQNFDVLTTTVTNYEDLNIQWLFLYMYHSAQSRCLQWTEKMNTVLVTLSYVYQSIYLSYKIITHYHSLII